jgi:hypothetical protein
LISINISYKAMSPDAETFIDERRLRLAEVNSNHSLIRRRIEPYGDEALRRLMLLVNTCPVPVNGWVYRLRQSIRREVMYYLNNIHDFVLIAPFSDVFDPNTILDLRSNCDDCDMLDHLLNHVTPSLNFPVLNES